MAYLGPVSAHEPFWDAPDKLRKRNSNMVAFYHHALILGPLELFYILNVLTSGSHSFNHYRVWLAFHGKDWFSSFDAFLLCRVKVNLTDSHLPMRAQLLTHNSFLMGWLIFSCNCYSCCWAINFKLSLCGITGLLVSQSIVRWANESVVTLEWAGCHVTIITDSLWTEQRSSGWVV